MRLKTILGLTAICLAVCGCQAEQKNPQLSATTEKKVTTTEVTEPEVVIPPIVFGEANKTANAGHDEFTLKVYQTQIGKINFVPIYFNDRPLNEDNYDAFISFIEASPYYVDTVKKELDDGSTSSELYFSNGDSFRFTNKELTFLSVDGVYNDQFPVDYSVMDIRFEMTVPLINDTLGTEFTDYPELRCLTILDENSTSFIQYNLTDGVVKEMIYSK